MQVKGLVARGGGRALDHLSLDCHLVLASRAGIRGHQVVFIGIAVAWAGSPE